MTKENKMNNQENNKLISEFMGWDIQNPTTIPNNLHLSNLELDNGDVMELKFHSSWDWLMPVVETCYHNGADGNEIGDITHALLDCDIDHTYKAVVKFINEYNN